MALVEDIKTGKCKEVRADNLLNGNTVSLGRIKKERYKEYMAAQNAALYMDLDGIDAGTMAAAVATVGVDAFTGEPIEIAEPKKPTPPVAVKSERVKAEVISRNDLLIWDVPYEQTEAGYIALENYWREFKHEPPEGFALKDWYLGKVQKKAFR